VILADVGKFVGAKVATAIIFLAVAAGGYWCYQHPESVKAGADVVKLTLVWIVFAAALPWSSYFFMRPLLARQSEMQSSQAAGAVGVAVIAAFSVLDVLLAFYLAGWSIAGTLTWIVVLLGFAAAAAYNFVICESLARQADA
jgi:hypothetical protein